MAAIDFPNSPTTGQLFTEGDITWEWTGTVWQGQGTTIAGPAGAPGEPNFSSFLLMGA